MKKLMSLVLVLTTVFFVTACDTNGEIGNDILPGIELAGDSVMEIEQYSDFIDPGASILGDFDLEVVTDSNVDTSTLGEYTITYTITYLTVEYIVSRTVVVVEVLSGETPNFELVGDAVIQVEQYSLFVDPGVGILDSLGLDVVVVNEVDTNILGSYTITYTITYMEQDYSLTRSVEVIEAQVILIPTIQLDGDASVVIELYSDFDDPGVLVGAVVGLDVDVQSDLDTDTIGTYTITYTITYMDVDYSVSRSVEVIEESSLFDYDLTLDVVEITQTSIDFQLIVNDDESILFERFVKLYVDDVEVGSLEYVTGVNTFEFTDLVPGVTYQMVVEGQYLNDDETVTIEEVVHDFATLGLGEFTVTYDDVVALEDSVAFTVEVVDEDELITSMEVNLYLEEVLVDSYTLELGSNSILFESLNSETLYQFEIVYTYIPFGGTVEDTFASFLIPVTTDASSAFEISGRDCYINYDYFECDITYDDTDFGSINIWAKLYLDGVYQGDMTLEDDYTYFEFDYLDEDTEYEVKIFANYVSLVLSEFYTNDELLTFTISTNPIPVAPIVENVVVTKTATSITVDFDLSDATGDFNSGYASIYRGWSTAGGSQSIYVGHNSFTFEESIYENELYEVRISADYKGYGTFEVLYSEELLTPPEITVDSFIQSEMFYVNDEVIVKIELDNDEKVAVDAVTIDGVRYDGDSIEFPSDIDTLYVNLGVYSSDGDYSVTLENLIVTLLEEEYEIETLESSEVTVYLVGSIVPDDAAAIVIDIVPEDYVIVVDYDDTFRTDVNISVFLDNPYGLEVTSIVIGGITYTVGDTLTIVSETELSFVASIGRYYQGGVTSSSNLYFGGITFIRNDETVLGYNSPAVSVGLIKEYDFDNDPSTASVIMLSTPADLQALSSSTLTRDVIYRLQNDIDMSGYAFTPIGQTYSDKFSATIDGNGFTISNITITETLAADADNRYFGLFGFMGGSIVDLTLDNINITISTTSDNYLYVGALAGHSTGSIYNVHVKNSMITIDGIIEGDIGGMFGHQHGLIINSSADTDIVIVSMSSESTSYRMYVGGFVGNKEYDDIRNSSASGDITITLMNYYTIYGGGLIGIIGNNGSGANTQYVSNSFATGDLTITTNGFSRIGGLIGVTNIETVILNSYASGDLQTVYGKVGGLLGQSDSKVISSFSTSTVYSEEGSASRLFGTGNEYKFTNIFAYDGQLVTYDGITDSLGSDDYYINIGEAGWEQFNDSEYYTDFLGWSPHFYDFTNLDIENGDVPIFRSN